ncbi:hypothetical protein Tco_0934557 [Tanacetum coccineum]
MDSLMLQMGYASDTNWYYFLKPGCNLDNGLYNIREYVNLDCLGKLFLEHKMIDMYVENSKTRLEVSEMSPRSIGTMFNELDDNLKKDATASTPSCCRQLVIGLTVNELLVDPCSQVTQTSMLAMNDVHYKSSTDNNK